MDRLARAVASQETCGCTCGVVLPTPNPDGVNNCFGINDRKTGRPVNFATKEDAYAAFKALWVSGYGGFPDAAKATKYVKGPGYKGPPSCSWLANVATYYNRGL